jgi:hypothetical protein
MGVRALADREFEKAADYFAAAQQQGSLPFLANYRVYALCMGGKIEDARKVASEQKDLFSGDSGSHYEEWLKKTFGW